MDVWTQKSQHRSRSIEIKIATKSRPIRLIIKKCRDFLECFYTPVKTFLTCWKSDRAKRYFWKLPRLLRLSTNWPRLWVTKKSQFQSFLNLSRLCWTLIPILKKVSVSVLISINCWDIHAYISFTWKRMRPGDILFSTMSPSQLVLTVETSMSTLALLGKGDNCQDISTL
jgi:hypothetical protein